MKTVFGFKQWNKITPDKVIVWCDFISYLMLGVGGFSYVTKHSDIAYGITLLAGAINKFVPRLFGVASTGENIIEQQ